MSPLRLRGFLAAVIAAGCTNVALGDLQRGADGAAVDGSSLPDAAIAATDTPLPIDLPGALDTPATDPDVAAPLPDASAPSPDVVVPSPDVVVPSPDVVTPRPDVVAPSPDVVALSPDVVAPSPDVVTPRPDVVTPVDRPTVCEACTPFARVSFCPGTGAGACLSYAGCANGCAVCAPATAGGDTCTNAPVITTRDRSRTVFTTCGASDNLSAGCGRTGPDIAVTLRLANTGPVSVRITVPEGVGVVFGYDRFGGECRTESSQRACNNPDWQRTQGFDQTLSRGDWTLYIVTTVPSTVVVETDLP